MTSLVPTPLPPVPKVSVVVLTRNHGAYLAQALDSVLVQEVGFAYELIVGEDASTDQTRGILEEYAARYPAIIHPIYHALQVGVGANLRACFAACRGQYLAPLEGDDYWMDAHKLHTQVAWLEANPEFVFCFHQYCVVQAGQPPLTPPLPARGATVFEFADFLAYVAPHISTVVLRQVLPALPEWLFSVYPIDKPLLALYAEHGKAKLLPGVRSAYRVHAGGSWSAISQVRRIQQYVPMYKKLRQHYAGTAHESRANTGYARMYLGLADERIRAGDLAGGQHFFGHFWAAEISHATRGRLLKSLASVSLRLAKGHAVKLFAHLLHKKNFSRLKNKL